MTQQELMPSKQSSCQHPDEAYIDDVCIICKGQLLQEQDELSLFRSRLEQPPVKLAGDSKVVYLRRWWRQYWS